MATMTNEEIWDTFLNGYAPPFWLTEKFDKLKTAIRAADDVGYLLIKMVKHKCLPDFNKLCNTNLFYLKGAAQNPYLLSGLFHLFDTLDKYCQKYMDFTADSPERIRGLASRILKMGLNQDGHTAIRLSNLIPELAEKSGTDYETCANAIKTQMYDLIVYLKDSDMVALKYVCQNELAVYEILNDLKSKSPRLPFEDAQPKLSLSDTLTDLQREAVLNAFRSKISIISGGAGTGKTYVSRAIVDNAEALGLNVVLCAPTGKAARRMEELIGLESSTIHRLLSLRVGGDDEMSDNGIGLSADLLIIDECSMIDLFLYRNVLSAALEAGCSVVMVGDHNQLLPVGPGSVFRDLINHNYVPMTILTEVKRQAGDLKKNAVSILDGKVCLDKTDDWWVIQPRQEINGSILCQFLKENIAPLGFDIFKDVQILVPTHKNDAGTASINTAIREFLFESNTKTRRYLVGDRLICTKNDYDNNVMNGTIGFVVNDGSSNSSGKFVTIQVLYEGMTTPVSYDIHGPFGFIENVMYAYAITIHKSQGSEFPCVITIMANDPSSKWMWSSLSQNLTYTAVTRASNLSVLIGSESTMKMAVRNRASIKRQTLLAEILK